MLVKKQQMTIPKKNIWLTEKNVHIQNLSQNSDNSSLKLEILVAYTVRVELCDYLR